MQKFYAFSSMKSASVAIGIIALSQSFNSATAQQFTAGRLVVERVGNGAPQTDAATPTFLDEYSTTGVPGISISLPTVTTPPVNRTTESGLDASDGMINRSVDGSYLVVPGYDAALGTIAVTTTNSPKVVTRVDGNGNLASTVVTDATAFSGNNFRSVVTTDGSEYWLSGAGNGAVHIMHQGSTVPMPGTEVSNTITNNKGIFIYNSQLYQSTAVPPNTGVYSVGSGLPTAPGNTMTLDANTGATADPNSFVIVTNGTLPVMYVADYANKLIRKYFQSGASWFAAGSVTVTVGGTATGFYGITGNVVSGVVHLYATTTNGIGSNSRIVSFTDGTSGSTVISGTTVGTTIAGPTSNTSFRGISFVPFSVSGIGAALSSVCSGSGTSITIAGNPNTVVTYNVNGSGRPPVTLSSAGTYTFSTGPLTSNATYMITSATDGNITQTYAYSVTVSVNPLPAVSVSAGGAICPGGTLGLVASGASTYSWAPAAGLSATTGSNVAATPAATTTYTISGTDVNGCMNTTAVTVSVNPLPILSTSTPPAICAGASTSLVVSGAVAFTWSPAASLSASTGSHVTATPASSTTYTITGTGANGCVNTITLPVTVNALPPVSAGPDVAICAGQTTTLTGSGAVVYHWWPGTGLSALIGTTVNASPASTTTYTVTGTDANGCNGTASVTVNVNPLPVVSAGPDVDICIGASTTLNASGAATYVWTPPATLSSPFGTSVTATPTVTTTYTVTGTDINGCVNSGRVTVNVHPAPYIFPGPGVGICTGSSTPLYVTGSASFSWAPATGLSTTTGALVTANPTSNTTYTITGTDIHGCTNTATITVTVYPIPVVSAGPNVAICTGSSTTLTATGGGTYTWAPGFGLSVTTGSTVTAHPTSTTTYTVTAINVCIGTTTVTVSVNPLPTVTASGVTICRGSSGTIAASGATSYVWSPATGLSGTVGSSLTANPTSNTIYTVTGTDANGCVNRATASVLVNPLPNITAGPPVTMCFGIATPLTALGGTAYTWAPAAGLSATTGASVSANPASTTIYTITGVNGYGCVNTGTIAVNVNPLPVIFAVTGGGSFCAGGTGVPVDLASSEGGITYYLYRNGIFDGVSIPGTGSSITFGHPSFTGFYTVVGRNLTTGCSDTMAGGVGVTVIPFPAIVSVTGGGNYCQGGTGVDVGLAGSAAGVYYQLYHHGAVVDSLAGGGTPLDFGLQTDTGSYTVVATVTGTTCSRNMSGSATVGTLALPAVFAISGGGTFCSGGTGVHVGLVGSQIGEKYQVYLNGTTPMGTAIIGLGTPLDFGLFTSPGSYSVTAISTASHCTDTMSGSVTVSINPTPVLTGPTFIAKGTTGTVNATPAGGTFSSHNTSIATVSATGVVTGVSLGAVDITYTLPTGCYDVHNVTIAFNVGTRSVSAASEFSLAPNPNSGAFTLQGHLADAADGNARIEITNLLGQVVYTQNVIAHAGTIDEKIELNNTANGLYILSIRTGAETKQVRFVKE